MTDTREGFTPTEETFQPPVEANEPQAGLQTAGDFVPAEASAVDGNFDTLTDDTESSSRWTRGRTAVVAAVGGAVATVAAVVAFSGGGETSEPTPNEPAVAGSESDAPVEQPNEPIVVEANPSTEVEGSDIETDVSGEWVEGTPKPLEGIDVLELADSFQYNMEQAMVLDDPEFLRVMGITEDSSNPNLEQMWVIFNAFGASASYDHELHTYSLSEVVSTEASTQRIIVEAREEIVIAPIDAVGGTREQGLATVAVVFDRQPGEGQNWLVTDIYRPEVEQSIGTRAPQEFDS